MRVVELATQADPDCVADELFGAYHERVEREQVVRWQSLLRDGVLVGTDDLDAVVVTLATLPGGGETLHFSADGKTVHGGVVGLDFLPWNQWAGLRVLDETGENLSLDQLAAHVYYEMTWHGWPGQASAEDIEISDV